MTKNKIFAPFLILLALSLSIAGYFGFAFSLSSVNAAEEKPLVVSPDKIELVARPGQKIKSQFTLINRGNIAVRMKVVAKDFKINPETGQMEFYLAQNNGMTQWLIPEFLEVSLKPLQSKDIQFIVSIPKEVKSGGYFGAILFEQASQKINGPKTAFGGLVLLTIKGGEGKVYLGGKINDFSAPWLQGSFPIRFGLEVKDLGNTYFKSSGTILVKNWRGKQVANLKTDNLIVYPETSKTFFWKWTPQDLSVGFYRASVELTSQGKDPQKLTGRTWFIVFPWKEALAAVLASGLTIFVLAKYRAKIPFIGQAGHWLQVRIFVATNFLAGIFSKNEKLKNLRSKVSLWLGATKKIKEFFKRGAVKEEKLS